MAQLLPLKKSANPNGNFTALEAKLFKATIAHEFKDNRLNEHGINSTIAAELMVDYLLASDLVRGDHWPLVRNLAESFGKDFLSEKESLRYAELQKMDPLKAKTYLTDKALPYSLGLWCFALTLCHRLFFGGHTLSAMDAYWLGLVDEVIDEAHEGNKMINPVAAK
jgi:hypothetical protein